MVFHTGDLPPTATLVSEPTFLWTPINPGNHSDPLQSLTSNREKPYSVKMTCSFFESWTSGVGYLNFFSSIYLASCLSACLPTRELLSLDVESFLNPAVPVNCIILWDIITATLLYFVKTLWVFNGHVGVLWSLVWSVCGSFLLVRILQPAEKIIAIFQYRNYHYCNFHSTWCLIRVFLFSYWLPSNKN